MKARNVFALLIAAVLAAMMVMALIPASVISAAIPAAEALAEPDEELPAANEAEPVADPAADDVAELLDKEGNHVGYYKTLKAADDALKDGYTLKFLKDITSSSVYTWRQINPAKYNANGFSSPNTTQIVYTIDGNGHTYTFTGGTKGGDYAWVFDSKSAADIVTVKDVTVRSNWGGISLNPGTGAGMTINLEDSKVYAGKMYDVLVAKTATEGQDGIGLYVSTINTYLNVYDSSASGYDSTMVATYTSSAVSSYGIASIFGGTFYTAHADSTIEARNGTEPTSGRCDHKVQIFDGLIVNDGFCAARPLGGASLYILGGTFVETGLGAHGADAGTAVLRTSGGNGQGFLYVLGGDFFLNSTGGSITANSAAICSYGWGVAQIAGGNFYYPNAGKTTYLMSGTAGTGVIATMPANAFGTEEANTVSVTVPNTTAANRTLTFTPAYKRSCACTVDPETAAANGYDVLIRDAEGTLVTALKFGTDAFHYEIKGTNKAAAPMAAALNRNVRYSFYLVPANGTWELLRNITAANFDNLCTAMGPVPITVQGNGFTLETTGVGDAKYFCYANGGNLTLRNINLLNSTSKGRCLQFGGNVNNPCEWTLDDGTTITATSGSAVYMSFHNTLNIKDATLTVKAATIAEYTDLIQAFGACTVNVYEGARLIHPNKATGGTVYDGSVIACKFADADISSKKLYFRYNDVTVNLYGGTLSTGRTQAYLIYRADNAATAVTNVRGDVTMEWNEFPNCTGTHTAKVFHPGMVQILDGDGEEVATADNLREANAFLADGYTLKLLGDVYDCEMTIFDVPDISWEFDGNGCAAYGAATGERLIMFAGQNSKVDCHDLTVYTSTNGLIVGVENDNTVNTHVDFTDITVYPGGLSATNDERRNNTFGLCVGGVLASATVGGNTYIKGQNSDAIINRGQIVVNGGVYEVPLSGGSGEVLLSTGVNSAVTSRGYTSGGVTIINGGTFIGGTMSAVRANFGSTVIINGGNLVSAGSTDGGSGVIRASSDTSTGIIFVNGGKFFALGTVAGAGNSGSPYGFGQTSRGVIMFNNAEFYSCATYTGNMITTATGTQNANFWKGLTKTNTFLGAGATQTFDATDYPGASTSYDGGDTHYFNIGDYTFKAHGTVSGGTTNPLNVTLTNTGSDAFEVVSAAGTTTYKDGDFAYMMQNLPAGEVTVNLLKNVTVPGDTDIVALDYTDLTIRSKGSAHYTLTYTVSGDGSYAYHPHGALVVTLEDITLKANTPAKGYGLESSAVLNMGSGAILEAGYCYGINVYPYAIFNMYDGAYIYADTSVATNEACPASAFNYGCYHNSALVCAGDQAIFNMYGGKIGEKPDGSIASGAFAQMIGISASALVNLNGGVVISNTNRCVYLQGGGNTTNRTNFRGVTMLYTKTGALLYVAGGYSASINFDGCTIYGKINTGGTTATNILNFYSGYYYTADPALNTSTDPYKKQAPNCNLLAPNSGSLSVFNFYGGTFETSCTSRLFKSEGGNSTLNFYGGTFAHTGTSDIFAFSKVATDKVNVYAAGTTYKDSNGVSHTATGAVFNVPEHFAFAQDGTDNTKAVTFKINGGTYNCGLGCIRTYNAGSLTVTGGTFKPTKGPAIEMHDVSTATVSGGTFDLTSRQGSVLTTANTATCNFTGAVTIRVNGTDYTVNGADTAVAQVGSTTYNTVAAAVAALTDGATLTLLKNAFSYSTIAPSVNFTFNGNGHLLYDLGPVNTPIIDATAGKTVTVTGGIFRSNNTDANVGLFRSNGGTLNIAAANDAGLYVESYTNLITIPDSTAGTVNVTGGTFLTDAIAIFTGYLAGEATVIVNGGNFRTTGASVLFDMQGAVTAHFIKGTFSALYYLRLGGSANTADKSVTVIIEPVNAADVTWTATNSTANMVWFQNNNGQAPTLIIKNGTFSLGGKTDSAIKMFGMGDETHGKIYIFGGNFSVTGGNKTTMMGGGSTKENAESLYIFGGTFNFAGGYDLISVGGGLGTRIYGGSFTSTNGIFVTMQGAFARSVDLYGAGVSVTVPIPAVNSVAKAALVSAGIIPNTSATSFTVTTTGVVGNNALMSNRSTSGGVLNIFGGSYTIPSGSGRGIVDTYNATNAIVNISGGTFVSNGTEAMLQAKGTSTWNITGGTFTANGEYTSASPKGSVVGLWNDAAWSGTFNVENATMKATSYIFYAANGSNGTVIFKNSSANGYTFFYEQADSYCNVTLDHADITTTNNGFHICAKGAYVAISNKRTISILNGTEFTAAAMVVYIGTGRAYDLVVTDSALTTTGNYNVIQDNSRFAETGTTYTLTDSTITGKGTNYAMVVLSCADVTISGCTFTAKSYALQMLASGEFPTGSLRIFNPTVTLNNCTMTSTGGYDACVSVEGGTCTINGGSYTNNGLCTVRVLGGACTGELRGANASVTRESNAVLVINGGTFTNTSVKGTSNAVVRCGGGSTYGWVTINGGTFVLDSTVAEQVIFKNNPNSTITINGGLFLADMEAPYFFKSNGTTSFAGVSNPANDIVAGDDFAPTVTYKGKQYRAYVVTPADENAPTLENGAQVRMVAGSTARTGLRFTATVDAATVEALEALGDVTYGTIIVPTAYAVKAMAKSGAVTHATLLAAGFDNVIDLVAVDGIEEDKDGNLTIRASLVNLGESNYGRSFSAIVYAKVNDTYYYGGFNAFLNARSMAYVAARALNDTEANYTEAQRTTLVHYLNTELPEGTFAIADKAAITAERLASIIVLTERAGYSLAGTRDAAEVAAGGKTYTDTLGHFNVMQGGCTDGTYLYYVLEWQCSGGNTECSVHQTKIVKYDPATNCVVACSAPLKIGHGNGMTYNPDLGSLVVIANSLTYNGIVYIDPDTLTITGNVDCSTGASIAYIAEGDNAGDYMIGSNYQFSILDSTTFTKGAAMGGGEVSGDKPLYTDRTDIWRQDGEVYGDKVLFVRGAKDGNTWESYIVIYDLATGNYLGAAQIPMAGFATREIENIAIIGDTAYVAYHAGGLCVYALTIR